MLLVRAALLADERGLDAWERWCASADRASIHSGEVRLLAGAYKPLRCLGAEGPMMTVAKGIYRRTWYINQLAVARNAEIVERLGAAGVPALVLKGFALAVLDYRDLGARPMEDLDLLVPPDLVAEAARALEPMGFRTREGEAQPTGLLANEIETVDALGNVVELHAYSLVESADDADLWERPVAFRLREVEAFAPAPAEALLLICAHGQRWNAVQPVSWALDAATIVRANGAALDWDRFVERARARQLIPAASRSVRFLDALDLEVPSEVLTRLRAAPAGRAQLLGDRAQRALPTRFSTAVLAADRCRRFRALAPPERRPSGIVDWLSDTWQVPGLLGLLREAGPRLRSLGRSLQEAEGP